MYSKKPQRTITSYVVFHEGTTIHATTWWAPTILQLRRKCCKICDGKYITIFGQLYQRNKGIVSEETRMNYCLLYHCKENNLVGLEKYLPSSQHI